MLLDEVLWLRRRDRRGGALAVVQVDGHSTARRGCAPSVGSRARAIPCGPIVQKVVQAHRELVVALDLGHAGAGSLMSIVGLLLMRVLV